MKILNVVILILLLLFMIINFIFLLDYMNSDGKKSIEPGTESKFYSLNGEDVKYLQKIVDFNNTTFENNGTVHFYYAAYQKLIMDKNNLKNYGDAKIKENQIISDENINNWSAKSNFQNPQFYYDSENKIFIDSNLNFCFREDFVYQTYLCSGKIIELININFPNTSNISKENSYYLEHNCDEDIKCCDKEYQCLYKCLEGYQEANGGNRTTTMIEKILRKCQKTCKIKLNTKNYIKPFCYLTGYIDSYTDMNITVIVGEMYLYLYSYPKFLISNSNESCEETCIKMKNKKCHNHLLNLLNSCDYLVDKYNCKVCKKKEIYGPGVYFEASSSNNLVQNITNIYCYFSFSDSTNCKYKDEHSIQRICACL